jgi:hypothetical protein
VEQRERASHARIDAPAILRNLTLLLCCFRLITGPLLACNACFGCCICRLCYVHGGSKASLICLIQQIEKTRDHNGSQTLNGLFKIGPIQKMGLNVSFDHKDR